MSTQTERFAARGACHSIQYTTPKFTKPSPGNGRIMAAIIAVPTVTLLGLVVIAALLGLG